MRQRVVAGAFAVMCSAVLGAQQQPQVEVPVGPASVRVSVSGAQGDSRAAVERALTVVESRVTTGRPYSAEATTEFVQVLGDGNRINRRTMVRVYRDSDGRTRREEFGSGDAPTLVTIYDPVAGASYVLDPAKRTARKSAIRTLTATLRQGEVAAAAGGRGGAAQVPATVEARQKVEAEFQAGFAAGSASAGSVAVVPSAVPAASGRGGAATTRGTSESLGQQMVGGVMATGTRRTTVIPAGRIGNAQEITILSEQWMADDLQVLVMTRHSDPRSGETTYRLTNIVRAEPGAGLFDVPADYTVTEAQSYRTPQ